MIEEGRASGCLELPPGRWVRRRYRVEGGFIRPVPGELIEEYDLTEALRASAACKSATTPAEGLLLLDPKDLAAVEAFVSRWGLLGLVLEERWVHVALWWRHGSLPARLYPLCGDLDAGSARGLAAYWKGSYHDLFFAEIPPRWGRDVWDRLGEPLCLFQRAVREYQEAARLIARWPRQRTQPPAPALLRTLREHTVAVRPELRVTQGPRGQHDVALVLPYPSLLASCYGSLQHSLASEVLLRLCGNETCGRVFHSRRLNHRFCSRECREAQKSRRYRGRQRPAA